jgi:hypothetical protein
MIFGVRLASSEPGVTAVEARWRFDTASAGGSHPLICPGPIVLETESPTARLASGTTRAGVETHGKWPGRNGARYPERCRPLSVEGEEDAFAELHETAPEP